MGTEGCASNLAKKNGLTFVPKIPASILTSEGLRVSPDFEVGSQVTFLEIFSVITSSLRRGTKGSKLAKKNGLISALEVYSLTHP